MGGTTLFDENICDIVDSKIFFTRKAVRVFCQRICLSNIHSHNTFSIIIFQDLYMSTQKENTTLREENRVLQEKIADLQEQNTDLNTIQKESLQVPSSPPPSKPAASSLPLMATVALGALAVGYWLGRR